CINSASGYPLGRAFEMTTRWFGAPVQRVEDDRLLRGHGRYTDDIDEGALECCFVRSPYAHARITGIDVRAARQLAGVVAVYTAADLPFGGVDLPLLIPHRNLTHGRTQRCLASDVVRYAGEAVAFVIAESRYVAEDAAELVQVEYEPLPVVITPEAAARAEHLVHEDVPGHVADVDPRRPCGPLRAAGVERRGDRAGRRRRLRAEDHALLPRRAPRPVRRDAARPACEVDRGPPGTLHRGQPGARTGARGRGRL